MERGGEEEGGEGEDRIDYNLIRSESLKLNSHAVTGGPTGEDEDEKNKTAMLFIMPGRPSP